MGLSDFTFYDVIRRNAVSFADYDAWFEVDDGRTITFAGYKKQVDRLAAGLQKKGIQKGDRLGVLAKNSLEYFLIYGAVAALGAIVLPINWRLSAEEMKYNLNDCEPKMVFADDSFQEIIQLLRNDLPSVEHFIAMGTGGKGPEDFASLLDAGEDFVPAEVSSDDGFVIIHTAAVAGRPRGALLSHGNGLCIDMHFGWLCNLTHEDVHLNLLPLFHVGGLFMATSSFHAGAVNVNMSKFDAKKALDLILERKVSFMFDFAPILSSILDEHAKTKGNISSLRAVLGLESPEVIEQYQEITGGTFYCLYGQTETSGFATLTSYNERPGSAGRMFPLADVRLVGDDDLPVSAGEVGEITVKGPMVFKGYWNLPEDSAHTFRGGRHHTGDLGRFDEKGFLWYAGRKAEKELIKPGGENVYPAEVEKVILEHPAIDATVVFGVPDPKWKEGIKAVCRLKSGQRLEATELIEFVGGRIARYKKPRYVQFVTEFPLQKDGSPDRAKIKELYGGEQ
ncbi:MAG: AMP-binding protein [Desulfatiglandaceae bacterium]